MSLQVKIKLKLSKIRKSIKIRYNTFEKATFDEYLISSLALHSNSSEASTYIDDLTGGGSLNPYFKRLFEKINVLSKEQLRKIMVNSMFPILKIDESNWYYYYPEIDMSELHFKLYKGDLGDYSDILEKLQIYEDVIDISIMDKNVYDKPEPYQVEIDNKNIRVRIQNVWIDIGMNLFQSLVYNELDSIRNYKGKIHKKADGNNWNVLNNATIDNLFSNENFFYMDGDHSQIREDNVRKTTVSFIKGLYIYKETLIKYKENQDLCEKVIDFLVSNNSLYAFRIKPLIDIIKNTNELTAQKIVNIILEKKESREMTLYGLELLESGLLNNWTKASLRAMLNIASLNQIEKIYKVNPSLNYKIENLLNINSNFLTQTHRKQVNDYYQNLKEMKDTIILITGEVAASGFRESVKKLKSDRDTKKFSKLCNELIGHVNKNLSDASLIDTERWLNQAIEQKELMVKISKNIL